MNVLVVGVGSPDRSDDAVGPVVAGAVARLISAHPELDGGVAQVTVVEHRDPTDLLLDWAEHDLVVVVDAVRSGAPVGTVVLTDLTARPLMSWNRVGTGGTHAFGVATAAELGRRLGRLPRQLVVVGIEAGDLGIGTALSPAVADAVPQAARRVLDLVRQASAALAPAAAGGDAGVPR